ncbi:DNA damage-induced cell division inhibitor SosA [Staphylococcus caeli]|uniref:DNA damage-induced cell division inhibitor SosA n=1 Tax=Staphylococcus caeli TaxID=2201815 RepID=UPI003F57DE11
MIKINKSQIKAYMVVLVVTMVLCALFILSAHNNANSEQTYEMTDHQMVQQSSDNEQKNVETEQKSEHEAQPVFASVH